VTPHRILIQILYRNVETGLFRHNGFAHLFVFARDIRLESTVAVQASKRFSGFIFTAVE
jgi:hypothetical protein